MEKEEFILNKYNHKSKVLKGFALFLAFMLCCTIISRAIYAYRMPQVELGTVCRKSIEHSFSAMGSINAVNEVPVVLPAGLLIDKVCVREGESVTTDTVLVQLNMVSLKELIDALEERIALQEQQLKELKSNRTLAAQARKREAAFAKENLDNVTQSQELNVQQVRQRYDDATNALSAYPSWEAYYEEQIRQDTQYQSLLNDPEQEDGFHSYEEALTLSLQEAWEAGKAALENTVKEAQNALQTAENDKRVAIAQATHAKEDAEQATTDEKSNQMEIEQTIAHLKVELAVYQPLLEQEGRILSGMDGTVQTLNIRTGEKTPDTASLILADGSQGWIFETVLNHEQIMLLDGETTVSLKLQNSLGQLQNCSLLTVKKLDESNYAVTVNAGEGKLSQGMLGTLEFSRQQGPYDCCVPTSAIHSIDGRDYLFMVRETSTILGTELHVVRRQIKVLDRNDSVVALEDGALGQEEQFVTGCESELKNGDVVRPMEILP
ncbi:MAG: hypothetical protein IJ833_05435 [Lachnospiraceae bacterium]|nr:hypothetical protein [Lachnospiraceae bacterium]